MADTGESAAAAAEIGVEESKGTVAVEPVTVDDVKAAATAAENAVHTYVSGVATWASYGDKQAAIRRVNQAEGGLRKAFAAGGGEVVRNGEVPGAAVPGSTGVPAPGLLSVYDAAAVNPALLVYAAPFPGEAETPRVFPLADGDAQPGAVASGDRPRPSRVRRAAGQPACAPTVDAVRRNLDVFTEHALAAIDWDGVVVAGGCVLASLMATSGSARKLRKAFHRGLYSQADVDLFLVGFGKGPEEEVRACVRVCVRVCACGCMCEGASRHRVCGSHAGHSRVHVRICAVPCPGRHDHVVVTCRLAVARS